MSQLNQVIPLLFLGSVGGCFGSAPGSLAPVASPNGAFVVTPAVNPSKADRTKYLCVAFDVADAQGKPLHHVQSSASDTSKWAIGWHGDDTIVLYSSDVGTSAWKLGGDGAISQLDWPLPKEILSRAEELRAEKYGG